MADEQTAGAEVVSLTPWQATVRAAGHRWRARELLARDDADDAIRSLGELEAYYAVKAIGAMDAVPLLTVFEPVQIRALIDLEVFRDDRMATDDYLLWLSAFREAGHEALHRAARCLDRESLATLFRRRLLVAVRVDEDEEEIPTWVSNPPEDLQPVITTPDRRFWIAARTQDEWDEIEGSRVHIDEEERKLVLQLVDDLYRHEDFEFAASVLRTAESDMTSDLEEAAFRFRNARLEDLGFPTLVRALEIYARVEPEAVMREPGPRPELSELRLPALHAGRLDEGLFKAAMNIIEDAAKVHSIEAELLPLANAALVADRVDATNLEAVRQTLERVRAYIELALGHDTGPDERLDVARQRLETVPVRRLFAVGYTLTLKSKTRATQLANDDALATGERLSLLDEMERAVLEALLARRPMCTTALDGETPPRRRPFAGPSDLDRVDAVLTEVEALAELSRELNLPGVNADLADDVLPPEAERTIDGYLATLGARHLLGLSVEPTPLTRGQLQELVNACDADGLDEEAIAAAAAAVSALAGERASDLTRRVVRLLTGLEGQLAPLVGAAVDARFVEGVVRRP